MLAEERSPWHCEHPRTAIRWRVLRNGVGVWAMQCLRCGGQIRQVAKRDPVVLQMTEKIPFDEQLSTLFSNLYKEALNLRIQQDQERIDQQKREWWRWYNQYLLTPAWRAKRKAVMERAGSLCEGCRKRQATQVHHTTYDHVGDELLFELVAVCDSCHHTLHPDMDER